MLIKVHTIAWRIIFVGDVR